MESLYWFYPWRRRIQEGEAVFRFAVEQVREDETPEGLLLTAALLFRQASFNAEMGQAEQSNQLFQQAEQLLRDERLAGYDNRHTRADLLWLKSVANQVGINEGMPLCRQCWNIYRETGDQWGYAFATVYLGFLYQMIGDYQEALTLAQEGLKLARSSGDPRILAYAFRMLGKIISVENKEEGEKIQREGIALFKQIGERVGYADGLHLLADTVLIDQGKFEEALAIYEEVLPIFAELGVREFEAFSMAGIAGIKAIFGNYEEAYALNKKALGIAEKINGPIQISSLKHSLGILANVKGSFLEAQQLFYEVVTVYREKVERVFLSGALSGLGLTLLRQGQIDQARGYLIQALKVISEMKLPSQLNDVLPDISLYLAAQGEVERGVEIFALVAHNFPNWRRSSGFFRDYMADLHEAVAFLPSEVAEAAQECGCRRDLWQTARELLVELEGQAAGSGEPLFLDI